MAFEYYDNKVLQYEKKLQSAITKFGLIDSKKMTNTLQGSIWRALHKDSKQKVVVKVTNRMLHDQSMTIINDKKCLIHENIIKERNILKYLTIDKHAPDFLVKYIGFFKSNKNYYLLMEDAGTSLFQFIVRAHEFISAGKIDIGEWHKMVKIILKQMIECIEYIHSKNVAHFDISLENFLINDIDVTVTADDKIIFCTDNTQIKICDFGLSEIFQNGSNFESNKWCGKSNYKSPEINKKERFCAKSNDIWNIGICLFMILIGGSPWYNAMDSDERFVEFMKPNGIKHLLTKWNKLNYVNDDLIELLKSILQPQDKRAALNDIKNCQFLQ